MKHLLMTASAFAIMATVSACGEPYQAATPGPDVVAEAPATTDEMADASATVPSTRPTYQLASGEREASDLIGASVHNPAGEEIANVADIWLGANGSAPVLVLRDGGVAGVGGTLRTVAFSAATVAEDPETTGDEPNLTVRLTDTTLEMMPEFEQAKMDDFHLASELIGTTANVMFNNEPARINDLILSSTGEVRYAVISPDVLSPGQIVIDGTAIKVAEGDTDGERVLDIDAKAFADAPEYPRE